MNVGGWIEKSMTVEGKVKGWEKNILQGYSQVLYHLLACGRSLKIPEFEHLGQAQLTRPQTDKDYS